MGPGACTVPGPLFARREAATPGGIHGAGASCSVPARDWGSVPREAGGPDASPLRRRDAVHRRAAPCARWRTLELGLLLVLQLLVKVLLPLQAVIV